MVTCNSSEHKGCLSVFLCSHMGCIKSSLRSNVTKVVILPSRYDQVRKDAMVFRREL